MQFLLDYGTWVIATMTGAFSALSFLVYRLVKGARKSSQPDARALSLIPSLNPPAAAPGPLPVGPSANSSEPLQDQDAESVARMFREGYRYFLTRTPGRNAQSKMAWYIYLADDEDRGPSGPQFGQPPLRWVFRDTAVILVADRRYFQSETAGEVAPSWVCLLKELERNRPQRPLDGVLVSFNASRLQLSARDEAKEAVKLDECASLFQDMLSALWERLGMKLLPVYALVSGCEQVTGFKEYALAQDKNSHKAALGWSSDFRADVRFEAAWIDRALDEVSQWVENGQLHWIAQQGAASKFTTDADKWLLFPSALKEIRRPAARFFGRLFGSLSNRGAVVVRGLYFTGAIGQPAEEPLFLERLIAEKVLGESRLAEPDERPYAMKNRWVKVCQALTAVMVACTVLAFYSPIPRLAGYAQLREKQKVINEIFREEEEPIAKQNPETCDDEDELAGRLLGQMAGLEPGWFGSPFIPWSWNSARQRSLINALRDAFGGSVLECVHMRLEQQIEDRIRQFDKQVAEAGDSDQHGRLTDWTNVFTSEMWTAAERSDQLQLLGQSGLGSVDDLIALLQYTKFEGAEKLGSDFKRNFRLFDQAIKEIVSDPHSTDGVSVNDRYLTKLDGSLQAAIQAIYSRRFEINLEEAQELSEALRSIYGRKEFQQLMNVESAMAAAIRDEGGSEFAWLAKPRFDPPAEYPKLYKFVMEHPFLGSADSDTRKRLRAQLDIGAFEFARLRNALLGEGTSPDGPLFQAKDGLLAPGTGVAKFEVWLKEVISLLKPYPVQGDRTSLRAGSPIAWRLDALNEAVEFYGAYRAALKQAPTAELRNSLPGVERVAGRLMELIAEANGSPATKARGPGEYANPEAEVANLVSAAPRLTELLGILATLASGHRYSSLDGFVKDQCLRALGMLSNLAAPLYRPGDPREASLATAYLAAFGVSTPDDLHAYLTIQRRQITMLTQYARPILDLLSHADRAAMKSEDARFWLAISADLGAYEQKSPQSQLALLERFLTAEAVKLAGHCATAERAAERTLASGDYFKDRRRAVQSLLIRHCQDVLGVQQSDRVYLIQSALQKLNWHSRFPFAGARRGEFLPAVPFDEVQKVFAGVELPLNKELASGNVSREAAQLEAWRAFFGKSLKRGEALAYEFTVEFDPIRSDRYGCSSNQIIDWQLTVGTAVFRYPPYPPANPPASLSGLWTYGQPVQLTLRWAHDAPCAPAPPANQGASLSVKGSSATVAFDDPWSLLRLIASNAVLASEDSRPHLLEISIPVVERANPAKPLHTNAYVRIALRPVGEKNSVRLPEPNPLQDGKQ